MELSRIIAVRNDKTVYRDKDKCIKVFNSGYSKADILNEALNQARIEETGLSIPKILEVTMIDGKWAIVYEYIDGTTLDVLMQKEPDKADEYIELLVDLQIKVHSLNSPLLNRLRDRLNHKIAMSELDATTRFALHARIEDMPRHNKICHGDFNPTNIIISCDGTPYITDWSHATQGNASGDVAGTYLSFLLKEDNEGAEKYLDLFCKKSGTEREYVLGWLPFVAAAKSVKDIKDRDFLLSLVKTTK